MDKKVNLKNDFCLVLCCALSITVITGIVFSLDGYKPALNIELAMEEANTSLNKYCVQNDISPCGMKLVDVTPPRGFRGLEFSILLSHGWSNLCQGSG